MKNYQKTHYTLTVKKSNLPKVIALLIVCGLLATVMTAHQITARAASISNSNANDRAVVAFAGDSNMAFNGFQSVLNTNFGTTVFDSSQLDNNYVPVFITRVGSGIRTSNCLVAAGCTTTDFWKVKLAQTFTKVKPDALVTELGINDTNGPGTPTSPGYASYGQKVDYFMQQIPTATMVFWTNLPCQIEPPDRFTGCAAVNTALRQAVSRWHNLQIIDWSAAANTHPEYLPTIGPVHGRIHYTPAGYSAWTQLVMSSLDAKYPSIQ